MDSGWLETPGHGGMQEVTQCSSPLGSHRLSEHCPIAAASRSLHQAPACPPVLQPLQQHLDPMVPPLPYQGSHS